MVLILSDAFDTHADVVVEELKEKNIDYFRFNLDVESLKYTHISFLNNIWVIRDKMGVIYKSTDISCVWCRRPFVELTLQENSDTSVDFKIWKNEWNKTLLGLYNSIKDLPWLNPLRKAYKGENKYLQMEIANEIGFNMPETLVTNDLNLINDFFEAHKKVLFKLMSQELYDLGNNEYKGLYTNIVSKEDFNDFSNEEENPIVLQAYIDKGFEVRYTVIGDAHFVCKIESQKSDRAKEDWRRYDIAHTPHYKIDPPADIKLKVGEFMRRMQLEYGALDFIVTPDNQWYFLEINCMGQFLWIEQLTGMPISKEIVKWIENHIK